MLIPRQLQLAEAHSLTCFHLWSRVDPAAGASLSADALKIHAAQLLKRLGNAYAVRLQGFSIENDQFHLVLHWVPGEAAMWSDEEAVQRWRRAHPLRLRDHQARADDAPPPDTHDPQAEIQLPADPAVIRRKLADLSRFMQQFKQLISRRVNRSAGRHGPLWQGRFKLAQVKDAAELAGVMAFIDLRAVAHGDGQRPEEAPFTSIHTRVGRYQAMHGMGGDTPHAQDEAARFGPEVAQVLREGEEPWMPAPDAGDLPPLEMPPMDMPSDLPPPGVAPPKFWLLALREDSPLLAGPAAPKGLLAWLPLRQYLKLLDALVEKAKAWPHLPADAPGRAPAPATPAWEGALEALLAGLGLGAAGFAAQWRRLASLRG